jgi:hypothetical protein
MASEAALLGVPAIYIDEKGRGYTDLEGEFGLVFNFKPEQQEKAISLAESILKDYNKNKYNNQKSKFLKDKINVTSFLVWFLENFPKSYRIIKENPNYQYKFK